MGYLRLVRFSVDCGRQGEIEGLTVYDEESWGYLQQAIERDEKMFFYETLGKHSQITVSCKEEGIFRVESEDQEFLSKLVDLLGAHISGVYPLDYLPEE